jgi:heptosyltransferase-2
MATPALRLIRARLPGIFIGGLMRPGIDQVLAGTDFFDETHVDRAAGVMGPKHAAAKLRPRRYDTALLLTNSFSTALIARIAGIPRRIGYSRDARGLLLTDRLYAPTRSDGRWAPVPAVRYYLHAASYLLGAAPARLEQPSEPPPPGTRLELAATPAERAAAASLLSRAGVPPAARLVVLNPGGNNPAKRWPEDRFAAVADALSARGFTVLVNGSPNEADLVARIAALARTQAIQLSAHGITLGALKGILAERTGDGPRCAVMITNDTGPRHLAAAFGVPTVALFGPTDHRWTTIPAERETVLVADSTLPASEVADDHPERCRVDRISLQAVLEAANGVLARSATP